MPNTNGLLNKSKTLQNNLRKTLQVMSNLYICLHENLNLDITVNESYT